MEQVFGTALISSKVQSIDLLYHRLDSNQGTDYIANEYILSFHLTNLKDMIKKEIVLEIKLQIKF